MPLCAALVREAAACQKQSTVRAPKDSKELLRSHPALQLEVALLQCDTSLLMSAHPPPPESWPDLHLVHLVFFVGLSVCRASGCTAAVAIVPGTQARAAGMGAACGTTERDCGPGDTQCLRCCAVSPDGSPGCCAAWTTLPHTTTGAVFDRPAMDGAMPRCIAVASVANAALLRAGLVSCASCVVCMLPDPESVAAVALHS